MNFSNTPGTGLSMRIEGKELRPFPPSPLFRMRALLHAWDALSLSCCAAHATGPAVRSEAPNSNPTRKPRLWLASSDFFRKKKSEEVGFEPTSPVKGFLFSRQAQSATLPLFQESIKLNPVKHFRSRMSEKY